MAKAITKQNFEAEVLKANGPVLVDFWASWCSPCRMQGPAIDELAEAGYQAVKVNVDEQQELASQFSVMSIPTLLIFKDGQVVEKMVGVQSKAKLQGLLESHK